MGTLIALILLAAPVDLSALSLGAEVDRLQVGSVLYVALESGGVAVVDVTGPPKLVGKFAEGRRVTRMALSGDTVMLVEARYDASAWSIRDPRAPVATSLEGPRQPAAEQPRMAAAPAPAPALAKEARVTDVRAGRAMFDVGAADGFTPGTHVKIVSMRLESKPDLATGTTVRAPSGETTAVLRIEQADAEHSMARLGRGDVASPGDRAMLTADRVSERLFVPRKAPFQWLAGFHLRPFLGLEASTGAGARSKPVGLLMDGYAAYYFDSVPVAVELSASPLGLTVGGSDSHYPMAFGGTVSYSTDYFEIGLGGGGLVGSEGPCFQGDVGIPDGCEVNSGFTINQRLRLGSLDGIHLGWRSSIFSRPDRFVFGVGRAEANVPLTSRLGLFGAGGGGENGWAFGEFGVRTYVGGAGARGTMIVSASLGYASIFDGPSRENIGGPSVAFGLEWRQ